MHGGRREARRGRAAVASSAEASFDAAPTVTGAVSSVARLRHRTPAPPRPRPWLQRARLLRGPGRCRPIPRTWSTCLRLPWRRRWASVGGDRAVRPSGRGLVGRTRARTRSPMRVRVSPKRPLLGLLQDLELRRPAHRHPTGRAAASLASVDRACRWSLPTPRISLPLLVLHGRLGLQRGEAPCRLRRPWTMAWSNDGAASGVGVVSDSALLPPNRLAARRRRVHSTAALELAFDGVTHPRRATARARPVARLGRRARRLLGRRLGPFALDLCRRVAAASWTTAWWPAWPRLFLG